MITNNKILLATIFISISAHAGAFYLWQPTSSIQYSLINPGQIQINIVATSSKSNSKNKTTDNLPLPENIKPASSSVIRTSKSDREVASGSVLLENENKILFEEDISTNSTTNKLTVQLRGKIKTALQKHLTYPQIARRRGWQGTVTVYVTVESDGDVRRVKLGKSSGYSLLDESAITALKKVGRLDELKPLLQGRTIPIELPIKYLLKDLGRNAPSA